MDAQEIAELQEYLVRCDQSEENGLCAVEEIPLQCALPAPSVRRPIFIPPGWCSAEQLAQFPSEIRQ